MSRLLKRTCAISLSVSSLAALSCDNTAAPNQPDENLLVPRQWMQLQSDQQGTGFNGVHTGFAGRARRKWAAGTGQNAASSPVVDNDGDIWIGNIDGQLVEISPNGIEKNRKYVGGSIFSSPAVDDHNRVYVLSQYENGNSFRTILHCWDPAIGFVGLNNPPTYRSTASPKIWGEYVFVPAGLKLRVFDRVTLALVAEKDGCPQTVCGDGPGPDDLIGLLGNLAGCLINLATLFIADLECGSEFTPGMYSLPKVDPSVAIVDNATIVDDVNKPIVIMATAQCLTAFDFDPTAANKLTIRWQQELVELDCDFEYLHVTTPAVLDGDQVVIGDNNGRVRSFYVDDGTPLWSYDAIVGGKRRAIVSPPVAGLRQIYVVTDHNLIVLDSDGDEISRTTLKGLCGGVSLSLDFVYAMTNEGIYTGSLDGNGNLVDRVFDDEVMDGQYLGASVPAIDYNGTVYLATPNGIMFAYGGGPLTLAAFRPAVSWISPTEGSSVYTSAGQTMHVALGAGQPFTGHVSITSDVDGVLCEFDANAATEGSCMTSAPLTLGPHILTAFATDPDGLQESAQVGVTVIAAPIQ